MKFAPDLYPRQRTGLLLVLGGLPFLAACLFTGYGQGAPFPLMMLTFYMGIGCGMLAGNTRTLRTRSGNGWRTR